MSPFFDFFFLAMMMIIIQGGWLVLIVEPSIVVRQADGIIIISIVCCRAVRYDDIIMNGMVLVDESACMQSKLDNMSCSPF